MLSPVTDMTRPVYGARPDDQAPPERSNHQMVPSRQENGASRPFSSRKRILEAVTGCLDSVVGGVGGATIIDGRIPHSILLEVFTQRGSGTEVVPDDKAASTGAPVVTSFGTAAGEIVTTGGAAPGGPAVSGTNTKGQS